MILFFIMCSSSLSLFPLSLIYTSPKNDGWKPFLDAIHSLAEHTRSLTHSLKSEPPHLLLFLQGPSPGPLALPRSALLRSATIKAWDRSLLSPPVSSSPLPLCFHPAPDSFSLRNLQRPPVDFKAKRMRISNHTFRVLRSALSRLSVLSLTPPSCSF